MSVDLFPPRPHIAPSPLQHYLLKRQEAVSEEVGISVLFQVSAGYGPNYTVVIHTFEGDESKARGDDLDEVIQEAALMLMGMREARLAYEQQRAERQKRLAAK
jgi:hypothetical protein